MRQTLLTTIVAVVGVLVLGTAVEAAPLTPPHPAREEAGLENSGAVRGDDVSGVFVGQGFGVFSEVQRMGLLLMLRIPTLGTSVAELGASRAGVRHSELSNCMWRCYLHWVLRCDESENPAIKSFCGELCEDSCFNNYVVD